MDRFFDLASTLRDHQPADTIEAEHLRRCRELLAASSDPFARDHFAPGHFTASAFVLDPTSSRVLLILHGKLGLWLQPGGHVEPGDRDLQAAARRELLEEAALDDVELLDPRRPLFDVDVHRIPPNPRKGEPAHEHFDLRVLLWARSTVVVAGSDARDVRWVELDAVAGLGSDQSVLRALRKIRSL